MVMLLKNPTFMWNCLGQATESFTVAGFSVCANLYELSDIRIERFLFQAFLPSFVQSMYGLRASTASFGKCVELVIELAT